MLFPLRIQIYWLIKLNRSSYMNVIKSNLKSDSGKINLNLLRKELDLSLMYYRILNKYIIKETMV